MTRAPRSGSPPSKSRGRAGRPPTESSATAQKRAVAGEKRDRRDALTELHKLEKVVEAVQRGDAWQNAITGLGIAGRDWTQSTAISTDAALSRQQIDDLYAQDNLAARIVDTIPEDGVQEWFEIVGVSGTAEAEFQRAVFAEFDRLKVKQKLLEWWKFGRKDGGGLLLLGVDDGRPIHMPLEVDQVREVRHLHHLERWMVYPDTIDIDPTSETFGEPLYYVLLPRALSGSTTYGEAPAEVRKMLNKGTAITRVHRSRVIPYSGVKVSERRKLMMLGWSYSNLQRAYWSIQNYRVLWAHIASCFKHMAQTVVKLAGYANLSAGDFAKAIQKRLTQLQMARSTLSIVPIDAEDSFEEQTLRGLSGALEVLKYAEEDLAQAADMSLVKLFGHLPQGFGKDDEAGRQNWAKRVRGQQEAHIKDPLELLIALVVKAKGIAEPEGWSLDFLPIDPPSRKDTAEIDKLEAEADHQRIEDAVIEPEEARNSLRADPKLRYQLSDGAARHDPVTNPEFVAKQQQMINPPAPVAEKTAPKKSAGAGEA